MKPRKKCQSGPPPALRQRIRDVDLGEPTREVDGDAAVLEDHARDRLGVDRGQRRDLDRAEQLAVQAVVRRVADLEMDVGDATIDAEREQLQKGGFVHSHRVESPLPS